MILTSFSSRSPSDVSLCALTSPHRDYTASHALPFTRARMPVRTSLEPVALTCYRTSYSAIRVRTLCWCNPPISLDIERGVRLSYYARRIGAGVRCGNGCRRSNRRRPSCRHGRFPACRIGWNWVEIVNQPLAAPELAAVRRSAHRGSPFGDRFPFLPASACFGDKMCVSPVPRSICRCAAACS